MVSATVDFNAPTALGGGGAMFTPMYQNPSLKVSDLVKYIQAGGADVLANINGVNSMMMKGILNNTPYPRSLLNAAREPLENAFI